MAAPANYLVSFQRPALHSSRTPPKCCFAALRLSGLGAAGPQDPLRELLDLSAVHSFFVRILEERLGHPIPSHDVKTTDPATIAITLHRWLNVLDLAVSAAMMRDALQKEPPREALEAVLRMY